MIAAIYIILIILLLYYFTKQNFTNQRHKNNNNNDNDNDKSAELISRLNMDMVKLINYMKLKYKNKCDNNYVMIKNACVTDATINYMINRIHYDPDSLIEHIPDESNKLTAYNDKKGDVIAICLRYIKDNKIYYHDYNTLVFVLLHEFSHTLNKAYDHNNNFWTIFGYVINDAKEVGIYSPVDYENKNVQYCNLTKEKIKELSDKKQVEFFTEDFQGINITYSPYFDPNKQDEIDLVRL